MTGEPLIDLLPGEQILWQGRPTARPPLRPVDRFLIPFSLFWFVGVVSLNALQWANGFSSPSWVVSSVVLVGAGFYIAFGRHPVESWMRRRLRYSVTDTRIVIRGRKSSSEQSLKISNLRAPEIDEKADGSGTIRFPIAGVPASPNQVLGYLHQSLDSVPQFLGIENVRSVYQIIQNQLRN